MLCHLGPLEIAASWVQRRQRRVLAYVSGRDQPLGANDDTMTLDEARRIAVDVAMLPEMLKR